MVNFLVQNKLIAGLILVVILGGLWFGLSGSSSPAPLLQTTESSPAEQQLVATLLTLRAINLSGTIFQDPVFTGLKDFSTQIQPEPSGRPDPFAPLVHREGVGDGADQAKIFLPPAEE